MTGITCGLPVTLASRRRQIVRRIRAPKSGPTEPLSNAPGPMASEVESIIAVDADSFSWWTSAEVTTVWLTGTVSNLIVAELIRLNGRSPDSG